MVSSIKLILLATAAPAPFIVRRNTAPRFWSLGRASSTVRYSWPWDLVCREEGVSRAASRGKIAATQHCGSARAVCEPIPRPEMSSSRPRRFSTAAPLGPRDANRSAAAAPAAAAAGSGKAKARGAAARGVAAKGTGSRGDAIQLEEDGSRLRTPRATRSARAGFARARPMALAAAVALRCRGALHLPALTRFDALAPLVAISATLIVSAAEKSLLAFGALTAALSLSPPPSSLVSLRSARCCCSRWLARAACTRWRLPVEPLGSSGPASGISVSGKARNILSGWRVGLRGGRALLGRDSLKGVMPWHGVPTKCIRYAIDRRVSFASHLIRFSVVRRAHGSHFFYFTHKSKSFAPGDCPLPRVAESSVCCAPIGCSAS